MKDHAHTLSDFRVPTLSIECEPCGRRSRYKRGLGLTVAKVAAAEAELDGFVRLEAEPVDGGRWSTAFAQRMAIAANRTT